MSQSFQEFSRIISPIDTKVFIADYWEQKPLFVSRNAPGFYDDALKTADIDVYFQNQHVSPGFLNVMLDGESCPPERWTYTLQKVSNNFTERQIDLKKLLKLFSQGATIIINSGETAFPSLIGLRRALESELKCFIQANIYITPPNSQGFAAHFDAHNVFILQIHGTKNWNLYETPIESPVRATSVESFGYERGEPQAAFEMQPGDLLYIPRGLVHCARAEKNASIHITIGPMVRNWSTLLKRLAKQADEDANFRRLLPHGLNTENEQADFAAEFAEHLQKLIARTDFSAVHRADFIEEQRTDNRGRFTDSLQLEQLTADSVVCRRAFLDYSIERNEEWLIVNFEGEELTLPVFLENSLVKIFDEKPFKINEIEGIPNEAGKTALVKRFIQAGFLTIISIK